MKSRRVFQLIDLDRTLFDTARFAKLLTDEINQLHPGLGDQLDAQFENAYKNEETFFLLRYLRQEMGDDDFEALVAHVVQREGAETFLLPGVKERLLVADELTPLRPSWGILTYGDEIDQRMKLSIIGLADAPVVISETPDKGSLLCTWQNDDSTFTLPEEYGSQTVDILTFEDDKLRAFHDTPSQVYRIWLTSDRRASQRAQAAGIAQLAIAKDLFESIDRLTSFITTENL
jgi:hypothetical protein